MLVFFCNIPAYLVVNVSVVVPDCGVEILINVLLMVCETETVRYFHGRYPFSGKWELVTSEEQALFGCRIWSNSLALFTSGAGENVAQSASFGSNSYRIRCRAPNVHPVHVQNCCALGQRQLGMICVVG